MSGMNPYEPPVDRKETAEKPKPPKIRDKIKQPETKIAIVFVITVLISLATILLPIISGPK